MPKSESNPPMRGGKRVLTPPPPGRRKKSPQIKKPKKKNKTIEDSVSEIRSKTTSRDFIRAIVVGLMTFQRDLQKFDLESRDLTRFYAMFLTAKAFNLDIYSLLEHRRVSRRTITSWLLGDGIPLNYANRLYARDSILQLVEARLEALGKQE